MGRTPPTPRTNPTLAVVQTVDPDLWTFVNLNLALVYLRSNRQADFLGVLEAVEPDRIGTTSVATRAFLSLAHILRYIACINAIILVLVILV